MTDARRASLEGNQYKMDCLVRSRAFATASSEVAP